MLHEFLSLEMRYFNCKARVSKMFFIVKFCTHQNHCYLYVLSVASPKVLTISTRVLTISTRVLTISTRVLTISTRVLTISTRVLTIEGNKDSIMASYCCYCCVDLLSWIGLLVAWYCFLVQIVSLITFSLILSCILNVAFHISIHFWTFILFLIVQELALWW